MAAESVFGFLVLLVCIHRSDPGMKEDRPMIEIITQIDDILIDSR